MGYRLLRITLLAPITCMYRNKFILIIILIISLARNILETRLDAVAGIYILNTLFY